MLNQGLNALTETSVSAEPYYRITTLVEYLWQQELPVTKNTWGRWNMLKIAQLHKIFRYKHKCDDTHES